MSHLSPYSGDSQQTFPENSCNGDCHTKSIKYEAFINEESRFSNENNIFSVNTLKLPTPEEFMKRFCKLPVTISPNSNMIIKKTKCYSEIFKLLDIRVKVDLFYNDLDNIITCNTNEAIHYSPFEIIKGIVNVTSVGSIYSSFKNLNLNILKLPCKRKATSDLYNNELQTQVSSNVCGLTGIQFSRQMFLINMKFEYIEYFHDLEYPYEHMIESICPDITLSQSSKSLQIEQVQINMSMNTFWTKHHKAKIEKNPHCNVQKREKELWNKRSYLNTHLSLWDTKNIIRIFQSVYWRLFNDFEKNSIKWRSLLYDFLIQFLSLVSNGKKDISIRKARNISLNNFKDVYGKEMSKIDKYSIELFSLKIQRILAKYSKNLSKLKTIRIILFVVYLLKFQIDLPEKTVRIIYWQVVLKWFCKFECCFFKLLSQLDSEDLQNSKHLKTKEDKFRTIFRSLLHQNLVQREKLSYCIYKCICDRVFTSYCQWLHHSKEFQLQESSWLVMGRLRKRKRGKKKDFHLGPCRVLKYEILSSLCSTKRKI